MSPEIAATPAARHIRLMLKPMLMTLLILLAPAAHAAPGDEMFAKLKGAVEEAEAADIAADIWATWLASGSPTVDLLMQRAIEATQAEDYATAHALLDRVILIQPDYPEAWHRRAGLFLQAEDFPEALRDLNQTLTLEPRHFGAWLGMGILLETLGGKRQALESYREVLALYPLMPQARAGADRLAKRAEGEAL